MMMIQTRHRGFYCHVRTIGLIVRTHVASQKTLVAMVNAVHWKKLLAVMTRFTAVLETWFATQAMTKLPIASCQTLPMTQQSQIEFNFKLSQINIHSDDDLVSPKKHLLFIQCAHASTKKKKNVELYQSIIMFNIIIL